MHLEDRLRGHPVFLARFFARSLKLALLMGLMACLCASLRVAFRTERMSVFGEACEVLAGGAEVALDRAFERLQAHSLLLAAIAPQMYLSWSYVLAGAPDMLAMHSTRWGGRRRWRDG